jgi:glutathionylspermidine synthase
MTFHDCAPRPDFQRIVAGQGLLYSTNADGSPYWNEEAYYAFSSREVDRLHAAARELHQMFLVAAAHVLKQKNGLSDLGIPSPLHDVIRRSWDDDQWEFYGRFDLTLDRDGVPKLIEYNADTPTGLLEASIIQWRWKEDQFPGANQFNSIHESLVTRWKELIRHLQLKAERVHFASVQKHAEDRMTVGYLAATAEEAGIPTSYLAVDEIGWNRQTAEFVDMQNRAIRQIFKLYPWEWLGTEAFAPQLRLTKWSILEPAWKAVLSSKRLLLTLQELYPKHRYLLRVSEQRLSGNYVRKPIFGREGANVSLYMNGAEVDRRKGPYGYGPQIFQEYGALLQARKGLYAQCGVWMAGPEPVGMGVRQDTRPVLGNTSQFVPHIIA